MANNFKVVVVGAGPVGLVAAYALTAAGIDFVVLEGRPEVVQDVGASLVLAPHSLRLLAQFGLLDKLRRTGTEILRTEDYAADGAQLKADYVGERVRTSFGCFNYAFHRAELLALLYENLPESARARVHVNKRLADITEEDEGVTVTCTDGSTYRGAIVLGADGVHSRTRRLMREAILAADPAADVDAEQPFPVEYKTMWCSFPRPYEFAPGDHCITHGDTASLQFICAHDRAWIFCYEKLPEEQRRRAAAAGKRVAYTDADLHAYAAKHGDSVIADGRLRLRDVFARRQTGGMANLEEGVLRTWSHGRVVLAGDACHKYTPNAGLGLNNGLQDVVVLVNELHRLLQTSSPLPSRDELTHAFARYHDMRKDTAASDLAFSWHSTRLHAWPNWVYWLFGRYLLFNLPGVDRLIWDNVIVPQVNRSYCLDFVDTAEPFQGKARWERPMKPLDKKAAAVVT